jgi:hypothetical protein
LVGGVAVLAVALASSPAVAKTKPSLCPAGRFVAGSSGGALLPGVSPALEGVGFDAEGHVTLDGCGPTTTSKAKASKRFTTLRAKWGTCGSFTKVALTAKVSSPGCTALSGKLKAKRQKQKTFTAARSTCGDGRVDAVAGEACDTGSPCPAGGACSASCTCPTPTTTTTSTTTTTTSTTTLGCVDADGDGWTTCDGDCCDSPQDCANPAQVNPGAIDLPGNLVDDDCNGVVDDAPTTCDMGLASDSANSNDYAKALDLCQVTTEAPPLAQRTWGVISAELLLADGTGAPAAASTSIRPNFGTDLAPQAGASFVVLSTGNAAAEGQTNPPHSPFQVLSGPGEGTSSAAPADWLAANGGAFPTAPGCPAAAGTAANDPAMLKLRIRVPTNARSFSVSAFFLSSEFPEYVCSPFNDVFVALLDSTFVPGMGETANPADKNIAVYHSVSGTYPVGVNLAHGNTGLFTQCVNGTTGCASGAVSGTINTCVGTSQLAGTGFEGTDPGDCDPNSLIGGGTGWLVLSGNVTPGETMEIRFAIWDTSDHLYDSVVLLDDWVWSTTPIQPGAHP